MADQVIGQLNDVGSTYTPDAAKPIETALENRTSTGWDVRFAPIYYNVSTGGGAAVLAQKECADATGYGDRGRLRRQRRGAGREHLVPGAHPEVPGHGAEFVRDLQRDELTTDEQKAKDNGYRVVFGGDLNVNPPARGWDGYQVLNPVYDTYRECAQLQDATSARDGQNTVNNSKIDYIFGAGHTSCAVSANGWGSDHHALRSTTLLP